MLISPSDSSHDPFQHVAEWVFRGGFMNRAYFGAAALALALTACGQDPSFVEKSIENSSNALPESANEKVMKFAFGKGSTPVVSDYLFVLDNSVSMVKYNQKVASGLAAIPNSSFPESSKLAVMTTMAAQDPLATKPIAHVDVNRQDYNCIDSEPGFLELVNNSGMQRFKSCAGNRSDYVAKYSMEACDSGWFDPFAVNSKGERCFSAALQNPFHVVVCEAGLLAVEQMIKRQGDKPLFRNGAAVNIIFVSDEQEGCKSPETRGEYSTAAKIQQLIKSNSQVSSVKIHGIVPTNVSAGIRKYTTEIAETGGVFIPMEQERSDYSEVIQKIIESKIDVTSPEFDLGSIATEIISVEVDGKATSNFEFDGHRTIKILNLDPSRPVQIAVKFI